MSLVGVYDELPISMPESFDFGVEKIWGSVSEGMDSSVSYFFSKISAMSKSAERKDDGLIGLPSSPMTAKEMGSCVKSQSLRDLTCSLNVFQGFL